MKDYYDQPEHWQQSMRLGQLTLLHAVIDFWPEGCRTALDVGCGDGQITHRLAHETGVKFTGLDGSSEALTHLQLPHILAETSNLPFADASFDVLTSFDTLEHLDDETEKKTWLELFRVAKSFVIVAVPFRENLLWSMTSCHSCGTPYHINWHQRSYNLQSFLNKIPIGWQLCDGILAGERYAPTLNKEVFFQRSFLTDKRYWSHSICPKCGTKGYKDSLNSFNISELPSSIKYAFADLVYKTELAKQSSCNHSEMVLVFAKNPSQYKRKQIPQASIKKESLNAIKLDSLIDNLNLVIHCPRIPDGRESPDNYQLRLPVYSQPTALEIIWREKQSKYPFTIKIIDEFGLILEKQVPSIEENSIFQINRKVFPGTDGLIVWFSSVEMIDHIILHGAVGYYSVIEPKTTGKIAYHLAAQGQWNWWIQCDGKQWLGIDQLDPLFSLASEEDKIELLELFKSVGVYEKALQDSSLKRVVRTDLRTAIKEMLPKKMQKTIKKILPNWIKDHLCKILLSYESKINSKCF